MKRLRQTIIVVFMGWFTLMMAAPVAAAAERGALFKASAHGHTMYLFGTMHVGMADYYPLEPRIRHAVENASALALEIDPAADPAALAQAIQTYGVHDPRDTSGHAMPGPLKGRLDKALRSYSINPENVAHLKPWLVATALTMSEFGVQGMRPELSVDAHVAAIARGRNVPIIELESLAAQLNIFNRMPHGDQWQMLADTVDSIESGRQHADVRIIIDAWRNADRRALEAIAERAQSDSTTGGLFLQKVLLEERNGPLADKLAALLKKQDRVVAAIGVLHLVGGETSVPAKLRARGITVERIY